MPNTPRGTKLSAVPRARRATSPRREQRQLILHITLDYIEPHIWRRIRVPESFTLHQLHRVIQFVFAWLDYHLYVFEIGKRRFEHPMGEMGYEPAVDVTLEEVGLKTGQRFTYTYDFGDDWRHVIRVEGFVPMPGEHEFDWTPRLLDGARAAPPEDVGGPPGYSMLLDSLENRRNEAPEEFRHMVPEGFDPERFDREIIEHGLALAAAWGAI